MRPVLASHKCKLRRRTAAMRQFAVVAVIFLLLTGASGGDLLTGLLGIYGCTRYVIHEIEYKEQKMAAKREAENGDANAQYELAMLPEYSGIEGSIWLCRAADAGHALARYSLGYWYEYGSDTRQFNTNSVQAYKWYSLAEESGKYDAGDAKRRVADKLTPEQLAEAERLVAEWQPGQCAAAVKLNEKGEDAKSPAS